MTSATPTGSEAVRQQDRETWADWIAEGPLGPEHAYVQSIRDGLEDDSGPILLARYRHYLSAAPSVSAEAVEGVVPLEALVEAIRDRRDNGGGSASYKQACDHIIEAARILALTGTGAGEGSRYITVWRTVDDALAWDFYVSESEREAGEVVVNLTRRGVTRATTYPIGAVVGSLSIDTLPTTNPRASTPADTGAGLGEGAES